MPAFHPETQPTGVGTDGIIVPIRIPPGYRRFNLRRAIVAQSQGSATSYSVHLTTDPMGHDHLQTIASIFGASPSEPADFDNGGEGYTWDPEDSDGVIYAHIIPNAGSDNAYNVRFLLSRSL